MYSLVNCMPVLEELRIGNLEYTQPSSFTINIINYLSYNLNIGLYIVRLSKQDLNVISIENIKNEIIIKNGDNTFIYNFTPAIGEYYNIILSSDNFKALAYSIYTFDPTELVFVEENENSAKHQIYKKSIREFDKYIFRKKYPNIPISRKESWYRLIFLLIVIFLVVFAIVYYIRRNRKNKKIKD